MGYKGMDLVNFECKTSEKPWSFWGPWSRSGPLVPLAQGNSKTPPEPDLFG